MAGGNSALIVYGSETGNAQDVAEELGRICQRLHFETVVTEMNLVELNHLVQFTVVICVISTTGQGEIPVNAKKLWKSLLRKKLPSGCLSRMSFTSFGLGDSSYPKFNWAARKLHKRLQQLGADEIYPRGEADDQHSDGLDTTFLPWATDLRSHLIAKYLPKDSSPLPNDIVLPPQVTLRMVDEPVNVTAVKNARDTNPDNTVDISNRGTGNSATSSTPDMEVERLWEQVKGPVPDHEQPSHPLALPRRAATDGDLDAQIVGNVRVTPESHWQDTRLITLILPSRHRYRPGDVLTIYPKNFPEDVDKLIKMMDWTAVADKPISYDIHRSRNFHAVNFIPQSAQFQELGKFTLRHLLTTSLDITAIPKRSFLEYMANFTKDEDHRERLREFTNPAYSDEFYDYTTRPRRSIIEVLEDFPSVKLPWTWAPAIFPRLRGRQYSIASGGIQKTSGAHGGYTKVQILVAIVKYRTVIKKLRQGVCSRYLSYLPEGSRIYVDITPGTFQFAPEDAKRHILMIAPGTGVAPMRSLIWERAFLCQSIENLNLGQATLIYGGRNKKADFYFENEWKFKELKLDVFTAFSRDQVQKIYVQDVIRQQVELVYNVMTSNGIVYVCGSSGRMPLAVREALISVIENFDPQRQKLKEDVVIDKQEGDVQKVRRAFAEDFLAMMEKEGRYVQETW